MIAKHDELRVLHEHRSDLGSRSRDGVAIVFAVKRGPRGTKCRHCDISIDPDENFVLIVSGGSSYCSLCLACAHDLGQAFQNLDDSGLAYSRAKHIMNDL